MRLERGRNFEQGQVVGLRLMTLKSKSDRVYRKVNRDIQASAKTCVIWH